MLQHLTLPELVVVLLLCAWLLLTISYAVFNNFTAKLIYRFNIFNWVSAYQLFTEKPKEYHIYYRDQLLNNQITDWHPVTLIPRYQFWHVLWYPGSFTPQTILSVTDNLMQYADAVQNKKNATLTERFNYRLILKYILQLPAPEDTRARQFKIEMTDSNSNNLKQLVSDLHAI